jgi:hypothetical protein
MRQGLNIARLMEAATRRPAHWTCTTPPPSAAPRRWAVTISVAWRRGQGRHHRVQPARPAPGPLFDPLKNLVLAGRGDDCIASYIDGRCVMQDGQVHGVDYPTLQRQAQQQFEN